MMAERNLEKPVIVGIRTGGVWLAQELRKRLNLNTEVGGWISPFIGMTSPASASIQGATFSFAV